MAPPTPLPDFVYKIVPTAPQTPIPAEYPLSDLDQQDGFVHLSTATQIPTTADLFFKTASSLWVLKLRYKPSWHDATNWDVPGCPHLYSNFGAEDVEGTKHFTRADDETWTDAMYIQAGFLV